VRIEEGAKAAMTDATAFLKSTRPAAGPALQIALGAGVARGVLVVAFAWVLSGVVDAAVFGGVELATLAGRLELLIALTLVRAGLGWIADQAAFQAAARVQKTLFHDLLDHVRALGPIRLTDAPTGELVTVLSDAVTAIEPYWRRYIPALATGLVIPLAIFVIVAPLDWLAGVVFAVTLPLAVVFLIFVGQGAERANARQWATLARLGGHLLDAVQGLPELKLFRAAKREIAVVAKMAEAYRRDTMAVLRIAFLSALVLEFFTTVAIAMTAVLIGFRLMWGEIGFHIGFFILLLAPEFYAPIRALGVERHAKMEATAAAERVVAFLDRPIPARPSALRRLTPAKAVALRFEGVRVVYDSGPPALDGIDLVIAPGEHVALVGPSGGGKSTLFALLLGFVEASAGRVLADGVPLAELDPAAWRALIAHVPQRTHLFDGDVVANVAMGRRPESGDVDSAVAKALVAARADGVVARLPEGVRTRLGENGFGLSGGEAQRLALARAFYRPGPLVLFDEPTAHLDRATEQALALALAELSAGRTTITIAHRLATVRHADRIVVLDRGRVVESGPHEALIAADGLYARLTAAARMRSSAEGDAA
jgi:ATP-binding cassette subfamily C protein CydD